MNRSLNRLKAYQLLLAWVLLPSLTQYALAQDLPANLRRSAAEVLGTINPDEVDDCIVQAFADPYPSLNGDRKSREFRWRVRVPDGANFNVTWAYGTIPNEEFPKSGRKIITKDRPLPASAGDVVIILRANGEPNASLELSLYGEFPQNMPFELQDPEGQKLKVIPDRKNANYYNSVMVRDADWLPYWKEGEPKLENLDRKKETRLSPEGKHVLMKHYLEVDRKQQGFAVWLEFKD
jgi:hypothetical protein